MNKCITILLTLFITNANAQWNSNTSVNTPVAIATKGQSNIHTVTDGAKGIIVTWEDNKNNTLTSTDIYAQRINTNGNAMWTTNGIVICNDAAMQKSVVITDAGNGSAIITWQDNRNGNSDIYAQKIDSSGNVLWANNGLAVVTKTTTQKNPKIITDNAGGAIIVWEDSVNLYYDIYAQRLNSAGVAQWPAGGVAICDAANLQLNPKIEIDALGGAIITWQDKRNGGDYDIFAQRVNANGVTQWTTNGIVVALELKTQHNPRIEPDGANGAYIAWEDKRSSIDYDIYAQHINSSGGATWASNGVLVCGATGNQSGTDLKFLGANIILAWKDNRSGSNQIFTQLLSNNGTAVMQGNGILLSNSIKSTNVNTVADGTGGAIITWQDSVGSNWNIEAQKINSVGTLLWNAGGIVVANAANNQINPAHVSDGAGGAIFAWEDNRTGIDYDLYAQRINSNGTLTSIENGSFVSSLKSLVYPNPITNKGIINVNNTESWNIKVYNLNGIVIENKNLITNYVINAEDYTNGIYTYKLLSTDGSKLLQGKFIINQ
ncbi:MAG: T9SS type A sorting domain-containing protein [Bacteroidia bacterium]|nr:T9SS type A sorting domain-containing protein [Bacteroidia bacterium]